MKITITGAAGYIGSKLIEKLCRSYKFEQIYAFDNLWYNQGHLVHNILKHSTVKFYNESVLDWSDNLKNAISDSDIVIPLAAIVGAPIVDKYPDYSTKLNYEWFKDLLNYLNKQLVVFPNTNSGYGSVEGICTEETPSNPVSLYGKLKQQAEDLLIKEYSKSVCFRLATVFGVSHRPRLDLLINNLVYNAMFDKHISVFNGSARRNYIHIDDIVRAFELAIFDPLDTLKFGIYNLGNDNINSTKLDLVKKICKMTGATYDEDNDTKDPDKRDYEVSSAKLYKTGYTPKISLEQGIEEMVSYLNYLPKSSEERERITGSMFNYT